MSESNAAQSEVSEEIILDDGQDDIQSLGQNDDSQLEDGQTDSAPVEDVEEETPLVEDGFQKRINKVTADKHDAIRRAEKLQRELDDIKGGPAEPDIKKPKLEDFDYDDAAYNEAMLDYKVDLRLKKQDEDRIQREQKIEAQRIQKSFNDQIVSLAKPDFAEVAGAIPEMAPEIVQAMMQFDKGAEIVYYLGTHLDVADNISNLPPSLAMIEIGKLSAKMDSKPQPKPSAAPDPIEPLSSGGSISQDRGPKGATFE